MRWIKTHGQKTKAVPMMGALSIGDFFVPALPTQTSVMLLSWLQPQRAALIAFTFAFAAALGASVLALLVLSIETYAQAVMPVEGDELYGHWQTLQSYIAQYGVIALFVMSLLPTPPRSMIILSLLSGLALFSVVFAVFAGKLVWFGLVVTLITRAPNWLMSLPWIGRRLSAILHKRDLDKRDNGIA
nr:hypothetical protein [Thaumasiovibrio subtropicus]